MREGYNKICFGLFLSILFLSVNVMAINGTTINFVKPGWQSFNITIGYSHINDFSFNISGEWYNSSYPSNITVDFDGNPNTEWSYLPYSSNITENASLIEFSWSTNSSAAQIDFMNENVNGTYLARLTNNVFIKSGYPGGGNIAIGSADNINPQILEVITDRSVTHAFLPSIIPLNGGYAGLYLTKGGSTYYCNSDHNFSSVVSCNLTLAEALVPKHLARAPDIVNFSWTEPVSSPSIVDSINNKLQGCGVPCNISINVSSATAGSVTFSGFKVVGHEPHANISIISENFSDYQINISPGSNLTDVEYSFGSIPVVNIIPVVADDDDPVLTADEIARYNVLVNNLAVAWDNLTNYSHPLNFIFYKNPKVISGYSVGENNFLMFSSKAFTLAKTLDSPLYPNINVVLDVHDYFPNEGASNMRSAVSPENVIGEIYMNGFSDSNNKTSQYFYYNEILMNTILHELAHTFIFYPQANGSTLFYADHPASFTDMSGFETYNISESPTGNEGYYEIYSILNQLRVYIGKADIGNIAPLLSPLDKMLLGILSYHEDENYTFYNANITWESDRYNVSEITPMIHNNTYDIYVVANRDVGFWDVRSNSFKIDMGTNTSFSVPKVNQENSALWIFAKDVGHPDYFKVFNNNAYSTNQTIINSIFSVNLISPPNASVSYSGDFTFYCKAYGNVSNITLYTNINGWAALTSNLSGRIINYTVSNINNGVYKWGCLSYDEMGNSSFTSNYTFISLKPVPQNSGSGGGNSGGGMSTNPIIKHKYIQVNISKNITRKITNATAIFIYLKNPMTGLNLTRLNLSVSSNNPNLSVTLDRYYIKNISPGEMQKINMSINGSKGEYDINFSIYIGSLNISKVFTMKVNLTRGEYRDAVIKKDYKEAVIKKVKQVNSELKNISWIMILVWIAVLVLIFILSKRKWKNILAKNKERIAVSASYVANLENPLTS